MSKKAKFSVVTLVAVAAAITFVSILSMNSESTETATARFGVASVRAAAPIGHIGNGKAAEAIEKAGDSERYVFAVFYREDNDQLAATREIVKSAKKKISRKSDVVEINITDQAEADVVKKYGANRAQLPLILVLAPNGAIMGGFPASKLTDDTKLVESVGCEASEQTLKALQQKNMVALCMQNKKTTDNKGAMQGVEEFLQDPKFGQTTAVVMVDPSDPVAAKFVTQLGLDPKSTVATTALLAPPGTVIGTFQGATPKDKLVSAVTAAAAPKSGGCCPPGSGKSCGPTTTAAPQSNPQALKVAPAPSTSIEQKVPITTKATEPTKKPSK